MVWMGSEGKERGGPFFWLLRIWNLRTPSGLLAPGVCAPGDPVYLCGQGEASFSGKTPGVRAFSLANLNSREVMEGDGNRPCAPAPTSFLLPLPSPQLASMPWRELRGD